MTDPHVTHCFNCSERMPHPEWCASCGGYFCGNCYHLAWHFCHGVDWETMTDFAGAVQ